MHFIRGGSFSQVHGSLEWEVFRSLHEMQWVSPSLPHPWQSTLFGRMAPQSQTMWVVFSHEQSLLVLGLCRCGGGFLPSVLVAGFSISIAVSLLERQGVGEESLLGTLVGRVQA
jgi:hypothetical protein